MYYGASVPEEDLRHLCPRQEYSFAPYSRATGPVVSPAVFFQELPTENSGDYRVCALALTDGQGQYGTRLRYVSHVVTQGRKALQGLPCAGGEGAESLEVLLADESGELEVRLYYVTYAVEDVLTRYMEIRNGGSGVIRIRKAGTALDLPGRDYELLELFGAYHHERAVVQRTPLKYGKQGSFSHKGASGHETNPFLALCRRGTTEDWGEAYGVNLVYSGNFENEVEVDKTGNTRLVTGISGYGFEWALEPGEIFTAPEAVFTYSAEGLGAMSRQFHDFIRRHIVPARFAFSHRPVVVNTWEAFGFAVDEEKILRLAAGAKELGAELLVLDDGWFRDDDSRGLGDWQVSEKKFPSGFPWLSARLHEMGLQFGLWFEPEMVNEDSGLYREHPDWVIGTDSERYLGRGQLVLDMGNPAVVDYLFSCLCRCLDDVAVEYIKWDMNRYISEAGSVFADNQGEVFHRYILGVYELLNRVTRRYPQILLESCAGGGGRFDLGMLCYAPQIWASDNTDPFVRTEIQLGTSLGYPNSVISSHFTAARVSGLNADMDFRFACAAFGVYGYELDPGALTAGRRRELREFTKEQAAWEELVLNGDLYRLLNRDGGNFAACMLVAKDRSRAVLTLVQYFYTAMEQTKRLRLRGLDRDGFYRCSLDGRVYRGAVLMNAGLRITGLVNGSGRAVRALLWRVE